MAQAFCVITAALTRIHFEYFHHHGIYTVTTNLGTAYHRAKQLQASTFHSFLSIFISKSSFHTTPWPALHPPPSIPTPSNACSRRFTPITLTDQQHRSMGRSRHCRPSSRRPRRIQSPASHRLPRRSPGGTRPSLARPSTPKNGEIFPTAPPPPHPTSMGSCLYLQGQRSMDCQTRPHQCT